MPRLTGQVIAGRYNLIEPIGRGAMGVVWRARDSLLDRDVAIKEVFFKGVISDEDRENAYKRTMREARTAARLSHRGVVTIYDVVEEDGRPWIIMEFVPSRSLEKVLSADGPLSPRRACRIGQQLLAALANAHAAGVLHRDVKPGNVLISDEPDGERAVLTDFGIAQFAGDPRLTQTGMVMGSPGFTAPERIRGGTATPASDLWSLGATLFAAVEGHGPYEKRGGAITTMTAIINEDAPVAKAAGPLGPLIAALLHRNPRLRPPAEAAGRMFSGVLPLLPPDPAFTRRTPKAIAGPADPGPAGTAADTAADPPAGTAADSAVDVDAAGPADTAEEKPATAQAPAGDDQTATADQAETPAASTADDPDSPIPDTPAAEGSTEARDDLPDNASAADAVDPVDAIDPVSAATEDEPAGDKAAADDSPESSASAASPEDAPAPGPPDEPDALDTPDIPDTPDQEGIPTVDAPVVNPSFRLAAALTEEPPTMVANGPPAITAAISSRVAPSDDAPTRPQPRPAVPLPPVPVPRRRSGRRALIAVAVLIILIGIGTAVALMTRHGLTTTGNTASASTSLPGAVKAIDSPASATPPGWSIKTVSPADRGTAGGFSIAVPSGWTVRQRTAATYLDSPDGNGYLDVDLTQHSRGDMMAEAQYVEHNALAEGHLPGYRRIGLQRVTIQGTSGAFWSFTWTTARGVTMEVNDLLFDLPTATGTQSYAVYFTTPAAQFPQSQGLPLFDQILQTFRPITD